ncbi:hypothetical protein JYB88_03015 [Shewanella cyperi]|uniref:Uncharacterized protein n=1 Tax=Shewanella cyperi TaxID=2814292 RepID=A0A975ALW7_9GAMM|nr:hypothetical protein [Shewanella cyperi]QSX30648.1 hypothetical protein JYB88_03015 [Shewanella cyperi]
MLENQLRSWLDTIIERPNVAAVNIGLIESPEGYAAYVIGANEYDPDNDDWACAEDFVPENKYCKLEIAPEEYWESVQQAVVEAIRILLDKAPTCPGLLLHVPVVTVGFDDGELVRVK